MSVNGRVVLFASCVLVGCADGREDADASGTHAGDAGDGDGTLGEASGSDGAADESGAPGSGGTEAGADEGGPGSSAGDDATTGDDGGDACMGDRVPAVAVDIATGGTHTCAVLVDGAVRCWGLGTNGQLGYGDLHSIGDDETPACAGDVDVGGHAVAVAAGGLHTCVLLDTGAVRCWGQGNNGQLGYGNPNNIGDDETPAQAGDIDLGGVAVQIAAGGVHTCALLDTGNVRCWGFGQYGRLGYGNTASIGDDESPAAAGDVDVGGVVVEVDGGGSHTCALMDAGTLRCWGFGNSGQLGYGGFVYPQGFGVGDDETPASVGDVNTGGAPVVALAAGAVHTCIVVDPCNAPSGVAPESVWLEVAPRCWGANESGQAGPFGSMWEAQEKHCVPLDALAVQVDAGASHSCATMTGGDAQCWGGGTYGQLGYGSTESVGSPSSEASPIEIGGVVTKIATGDYHTCALLEGGGVRCWGLGANGRLGHGGTDNVGDDETPMSVGDVPL